MSRPTTEPHRYQELPDGRQIPIYPGHQDRVGILLHAKGDPSGWKTLLPESQEWLDRHQAGVTR